jgi:alkanesulfonate monooxygenase SsuD/methylene tetrahydromethanopterin reductase-like flavin-dependent oxidoreductase (luciferase family)
MRLGLINHLHGRPGGGVPPPSWVSIKERAVVAEATGFDMFVFEDALLYRDANGADGVWESVSMAAALAAVTTRIQLGQSVINSPYRSPAMTAKIADTIDEISGGRYVLGIGAGNTPDSDYEAFGFPTDRRYSRFAEAIQIIHGLLKTGVCDFEGEYYTVKNAALVLRGPRDEGPPINIAAGGPKMLQLVAAYGDAWNWWGHSETIDQIRDRLYPIVGQLDEAMEAAGRNPASLGRTLDVYTVIPEDHYTEGSGPEAPITGTSTQIAEHILELGGLGFDEVRINVWPETRSAIESMGDVIELVHHA